MISLETSGERFEADFLTEDGLPFRGRVQPIEDVKVYPDDFSYVRSFLRVNPMWTGLAGRVVMNAHGERFILGDWARGYDGNSRIYRSYVMYPAIRQAPWTRVQTQLDPLTNQPRSTGTPTLLGQPWILIETLVRDLEVGGVREETFRCVTGAAVELGDVLDGKKVRKLQVTHGVRMLELA